MLFHLLPDERRRPYEPGGAIREVLPRLPLPPRTHPRVRTTAPAVGVDYVSPPHPP